MEINRSEIVKEIESKKKELEFLQRLLELRDEYDVSTRKYVQYRVPSRTRAGSSHLVTITTDDLKTACNCEAGSRGIECWAARGLRESRNHRGSFNVVVAIWDDASRQYRYAQKLATV